MGTAWIKNRDLVAPRNAQLLLCTRKNVVNTSADIVYVTG